MSSSLRALGRRLALVVAFAVGLAALVTGQTVVRYVTLTISGNSTDGDILYSTGSDVWLPLHPVTSGTRVLTNLGTSFRPDWSTVGTLIDANTSTFTNKTIDAEATGNVLTIPFQFQFTPAVCQNATASLGLSTPVSNPAVAACVTGTNTQLGTAEFADGANSLSMQGHFTLPTDWTGNIDVGGKWRTSATSGAVVWQVATICVADAETVDPAFNTASTVTETAKGTTLQLNDFSLTTITVTGCAPGEELFFKFFRDPANGSDTLAATAVLVGSLTFTVRRAM